MANFRHINYGRMLYESLRAYYSVNANGEMSLLYKYLAAFLAVLQQPFDSYAAFRTKEALIASCKWQIGQLTNVLNYLFDNALKRIFITQSVLYVVADPTFSYDPVNFDSVFAEETDVFEPTFSDPASESIVIIHVPVSANTTDLIATIEQIRVKGIPYVINEF